jgi:quinol monooxygenase YgiN
VLHLAKTGEFAAIRAGDADGRRVAKTARGLHQLMVVAWIGFRAQPHKRPEILSAIDEMIDRMRNSAGCGRGRLLVDSEDPNAFTVLSEWQSVDAANAFFESRGFQLFRGIRMLLRGEPLVVFDDVQQRVTKLLR